MQTAVQANTPPDAARSSARRARLVCVAAVALAGAVYLNALDNPFIYDDHRLIADNPALGDLSNLRAILWRDITRPVVNLSYAADVAAWGRGPFGLHLTNVVLHMINVALLAWVTWRLMDDAALRTGARQTASAAATAAPIAALLFAVHPLMTEAVGYISGRSEVLCGTFFLLALLAARQWMSTPRPAWLLLALLAWGLALGTKEIAVVLPVVLLAWDRWIVPAINPAARRQRLWRLHLPLFLIAAGLAVARLLVFWTVEHQSTIGVQWGFALIEFDVWRRYLTMLAVPAGQVIFHAVAPVTGLADPRAWPGLATVAIILALIVTQRARRPEISVGLAWFLCLLLPSTALVLMDRGELMAEHRVYLASAGVFIAVAGMAGRLRARLAGARTGSLMVWAGAAVIVTALAGRTVIRNALWESPTMVWLEAAERAPDAWVPQLFLGEELHRTNRHVEAIAVLRKAVALNPGEPAAHGKLGVCLAEQGQVDEAERAFLQMKALAPQAPEALNGLATVALLRGRTDEARNGYLDTLSVDPLNVAARRGLAAIDEHDGRAADALRWCEDIARLAPGTPGTDECISRNKAKLAGGRHDQR